ncbi:MAG: type III pantothenate kinase [Clostridia bacterium]|nr:type III pantothenate kinase [Clostridia bacterium]
MVLVIDAGNTNIVLAVYAAQDDLRMVSRIATNRAWTSDQYAVELDDILRLYSISPEEVSGAIISSVVPQITGALRRAVERVIGCDAMTVGPGIRTGLRIRTDNANEIGSDIIVASVAAAEKYDAPTVVIDMGTVTKLIILDEEKVLCGAVFAPGVRISAEALSEKTAQLPHVALEAPERVIGTGTSSCIRSGIIYGHAAMIDGICQRIEEQLGKKCTVIATGGHARSVYPHCRTEITYDENLLLEGLFSIYQRNAK